MAAVYVSLLHNPYHNLALEADLHRKIDAPTLFLYINAPCVVIGRAQNPWLEADIAFLAQAKIPLVRRQSGGGTVVHDLGNLNFSFISPKADYNKALHLQIVQGALESLGITTTLNARHDILLEGRKISGSAFRETRLNCFHHGTLLVHVDLPRLGKALSAPELNIKSNAIRSVKSPVINLRDRLPTLTIEQVQNALIAHFSAHHGTILTPVLLSERHLHHPEIQKDTALYQSHDWRYEKTFSSQ